MWIDFFVLHPEAEGDGQKKSLPVISPKNPDGNHERHKTHEKPRRCPIITFHLMDEEVACPNSMNFRVFCVFRGFNVPFWDNP